MSTAESVITQLENDIILANSATSINDTNVHDAIAHLIAGIAFINGKRYDCGTFILPANITTRVTIDHLLDAVPSAAFLFSVNSPKSENDEPLRYIRGQMRFSEDTPDATSSATAVNNTYGSLFGYNSTSPKIEWTNATLAFRANITYPLRSGLTYQWLAIA